MCLVPLKIRALQASKVGTLNLEATFERGKGPKLSLLSLPPMIGADLGPFHVSPVPLTKEWG